MISPTKYRLGKLRHGNQPATVEHLFSSPRCGAKARSTGKPCKKAALKGKKRCQLHGGRSTGPRTEAGKRKSRMGPTKHGHYAGPNNPVNGEAAGPLWRGHNVTSQATRDALKALGIKTARKAPGPRKYDRDRMGRFRLISPPAASPRDS